MTTISSTTKTCAAKKNRPSKKTPHVENRLVKVAVKKDRVVPVMEAEQQRGIYEVLPVVEVELRRM